MDITTLTPLERAVYGENLINKLSIKALNKVLPQLDKYLNKKIELSSGGLSTLFIVDKLEVPYNKENGSSYRSYLKVEYGYLKLWNDVTVRQRNYEGGGYGVEYHKRDIYLGKVDKAGCLVELFSKEDIVKDTRLNIKHSATKIKGVKEKIDKLEAQIRELKTHLI